MLVILVHNNEADRLARLRPALRPLCTAIGARLIEVSEQPATVRTPPYRITVWRLLVSFWTEYRWKRFQGTQAELHRFRLAFGKLRRCFRRDRRSLAYGPVVSQKHARAWEQLLRSDSRFAIILESDAVVRDDTIPRLSELVSSLSDNSGAPIYIDLAGGLDVIAMGVKPSSLTQEGDFLRLANFATNTTCGYLINRAFATLLTDGLKTKPYFWFLPIDWLVVALVLNSRDRDRIDCRHASPTIFNHGSFTGEYRSVSR